MSVEWIASILQGAVQIGTIYLFASLGEIYAERSGILNLGIEGMMIMGAATSFLFTLAYGHLAAILAALVIGMILGLILGVMAVSLRLNQVVVGLALTIFGTGMSGFLTHPTIRAGVLRTLNPHIPESLLTIQEAPKLPEVPIPILSNIPVIGRAFFSHNILVYISYVLSVFMWFILFKTRIGLSIRSVGENPGMADAMGVNVFLVRYLTSMLCGAFASLAGAYLFIGFHPFWQEGMTAGRGFIALALVILATWSPLRAIFGAYLFGGVEAIQYRLQVRGFGAQTPQFVLMLPYIVTIITLTSLSFESVRKRLGVPAALGVPYSREEI